MGEKKKKRDREEKEFCGKKLKTMNIIYIGISFDFINK